MPGLVAIALGAAGEALLFVPDMRWLGAVLLLAAMTLAGIAWGGQEWREEHRPGDQRTSVRRVPALRLAGIVLALLLTAAGWLAWLADPAAIFGLQGLCWVLSMTLLLATCARWYPPGEEKYLGPPWSRAEAILFLALIALAICTYLLGLADIPWRFHYDEAIAYSEALRFSRGPMISLFTTTWWDTSLPSLWFAVAGGLQRLAGEGIGAVRLSVALAGAVAVIPVYAIARLISGRVAAALAGFAIVTTPVALHYSRISIDNATTGVAWAISFYFLLRGLRSRRPGDFVWSGIVAGLSMYTFYGTRLLPYLLPAFAAYLIIFHRTLFRRLAGHLLLLAAGFLAGFGPLLAYFARYPDQWAGRGLAELNVPLEFPLTWERLAGDVITLAPLAARNFLSLSVIPSNDRFYWDPLLLPAQALMLLLGAGILLRRWRDPSAFLVLLAVGGVLFVGGTLVDAGHIPAFNHWTPVLPLFFVMLALPPAALLGSLKAAGPPWRLAGAVSLAAASLAIAVLGGYNYLFVYPARVPPAFEVAQGRYLASLAPGARVRFVGDSWIPYLGLVGEMMAPRVVAGDFLNPGRELPLPGDPPPDLAFVFNEDEQQYLPLIESYYPGGVASPLQTPGGSVGSTYEISGERILSRYGVRLTLDAPGASSKPIWQGQVPLVGQMPEELSAAYPLTATWSGAFFVPGGAPVSLLLDPPASTAKLWVMGEEAAFGAPLDLGPGWVLFCLRVKLAGAGDGPRLLAASGDSQPQELPESQLWPAEPGSGLAVTLGGQTIRHRIDPFVGSSILASDSALDDLVQPPQKRDPDFIPLGPPGGDGLIRWAGEVFAEGGTYRMELRTDGRARLWIDGTLLLNPCDFDPTPGGAPIRGGYTGPSAGVQLTPGWHQVMLELQATGKRGGLEWTWTRPDGVREIIPPTNLRYKPDNLPEGPISWPAAPQPVGCPTK